MGAGAGTAGALGLPVGGCGDVGSMPSRLKRFSPVSAMLSKAADVLRRSSGSGGAVAAICSLDLTDAP